MVNNMHRVSFNCNIQFKIVSKNFCMGTNVMGEKVKIQEEKKLTKNRTLIVLSLFYPVRDRLLHHRLIKAAGVLYFLLRGLAGVWS